MQPAKLLDWSDRTVVILASGPSLREQVSETSNLPRDARVIATNSTGLTHFADVIFGVDFMWWKTHHKMLPWAAQHRECWTTDRTAAERFGLNFVRGANEKGLVKDRVSTGGNSGYAAISLAVLFGAKRILLLGFDMQLGPEGEKHHHPDHPAPCTQAMCFADWIYRFDMLATDCAKAGVEVINCSTRTALTCFPRMTLEEALCQKP